MLKIFVPAGEYWDPVKEEFISIKGQSLQLEHSLVSVSKWEAKWNKPFISRSPNESKTTEQTLDYIRCMTLTQNVAPEVYVNIEYHPEIIEKIREYIDSPMTATTFADDKSRGRSREVITSEIIYYWMIALNIPFECQKWHLNRLLTLIKVCSIKNGPQKKMRKGDILSQNRALNAARRAKLHSKG